MATPTAAVLDRITIFPIKSLDGLPLREAAISEGGCLRHDREFAIVDEHGQLVIGKTNALVHTLRTRYDLESGTVELRAASDATWGRFHLQHDRIRLHEALSDHFGTRVQLVRETTGRLLDIPDKSGATLVSTASLEAAASWFPGMDPAESRRRFRATLEISGVPAFWEDRLFEPSEEGVAFSIGDVRFDGISARARCVVPTRHPETGEVARLFPRTFATRRAASLPDGSKVAELPHAYYLCVDCQIPASEVGKTLRVGDRVSLRA